MPLPADLLRPIDGPNPAGRYLRWDPVDTTYLDIDRARHEDEDLPQGEWTRDRKTADHAAVIRIATDALATKSKDLQIAAYLTQALLRHEGLAGFAAGLDLLRSLIEQFWDHVHPELEAGDATLRAAPLVWLSGGALVADVRSVPLDPRGHDLFQYRESRAIATEEQAEADPERRRARERAIAEGKLTPEEVYAGVDAAPTAWYERLVAEATGSLDRLYALGVVCESRFGEAAPSYVGLREALEDVRRVAGQLMDRKLQAEPDPAAADPASTKPTDPEPTALKPTELKPADPKPADPEPADPKATDPGPADARSLGPDSDPVTDRPIYGGDTAAALTLEPSGREDAAARIAAAARFLRAQRPTDAAPYALLRGFRWGELRTDHGALDPKLLAAPPTGMRTRLKALLLDARWAELLEAAEEVMAAPFGRGWLDLQRYVLTACDGLGVRYDGVAAAVRGALQALLRDLPMLPDSTLMDDSPAANGETRLWLHAEGLSGAAAAEQEPSPLSKAVEAPARRATLERAVARARASRPERAIELLLRQVEQERSPRARFLRRAQVAEIMVDAGLHAVALPILEEMAVQIEAHRLEAWEDGETIALPLGLLYRCMDRLRVDAVESGAREALYQRVCRLDPLRAIRLAGAAGEPEPDSSEPPAERQEPSGDALDD